MGQTPYSKPDLNDVYVRGQFSTHSQLNTARSDQNLVNVKRDEGGQETELQNMDK